VKYQFIENNSKEFNVERMCQALKVSKSGYYRYCQHKLSTRQQEDEQLLIVIQEAHRESRGLYGAPRIHAELKAQEIPCGKHRVARLMKENKLQGKAHRRQKWNPCVHYDYPVGQDYLRRQFNWAVPNVAKEIAGIMQWQKASFIH